MADERVGKDRGGLGRLPPGRHGLSREFVARNQRDRLTAGMISAVAEHGYHDATISQITGAAGVSRRTFYSYFSSKEECFFATYDVIADALTEITEGVAADETEWGDKVRAKVAATLDFFAANPDLARFTLIAPSRAGEEIASRYRAALERTHAAITEGIPPEVAERAPSLNVQHSLIGGMASLVIAKVERGEGERLRELLPELLELLLAPYLGQDEARRIASEAA